MVKRCSFNIRWIVTDGMPDVNISPKKATWPLVFSRLTSCLVKRPCAIKAESPIFELTLKLILDGHSGVLFDVLNHRVEVPRAIVRDGRLLLTILQKVDRRVALNKAGRIVVNAGRTMPYEGIRVNGQVRPTTLAIQAWRR